MSEVLNPMLLRHTCPVLLLGLLLAGPAHAQESAEPFPRLSPEQAGMSGARLQEAMDSVRTWVERERIRGGSLLVIRNGAIVFHEAAGWSDMERGSPLRTDHVVSMRSMTKPLVGAAVLMLVEEGRLRLEDRVADHLSSFDNPRSRDITVFQLLTHTAGLEGEIYNDQDGTGTPFGTLREAVDAVGARGPTLPPGTRYSYSDPGSSTLGALIARVSGMPAESFIERRILQPLDMRDSRLWLSADDPLRSRVTATYRRQGDGWERYWDNTQPESVPFFRASGGLWSTALDYARFMTMLMRHGELHGARLLDSVTVAHALQPHAAYVFPPGDRAERDRFYGFHMSVYTDQWRAVEAPFTAGIFEHSGSDGTVAWADPANDLLIVYLTQSRGHDTRMSLIRLVYAALQARGDAAAVDENREGRSPGRNRRRMWPDLGTAGCASLDLSEPVWPRRLGRKARANPAAAPSTSPAVGAEVPGAERWVRVEIKRVVETPTALPAPMQLLDYSTFNPRVVPSHEADAAPPRPGG